MSSVEQTVPAQRASLEELRSSLDAQRGPLEHVESAFKQGWDLIGDELEQARLSGRRPNKAWRDAYKLLRDMRGEEAEVGHAKLVDDYRAALQQHEKGLSRLVDDPFGDHDRYLQRMGEHLEPQLERVSGAEAECLAVSGVVGSEAMASNDQGLEEMDRTVTLLGMALGSVVGRGRDYMKKLTGPAVEQRVAAATPTAATLVPSEELLLAGPAARTPAALKEYYRLTYGADIEFEADGRPILKSIDGPIQALPGIGVAVSPDLEQGYAHGH